MNEELIARRTERAIRLAQTAWEQANRGLPSNAMTRVAAIPAAGALAAALLALPDEEDEKSVARMRQAILVARRAWERTHPETMGNPLAQTASKSVIGILAAGILNSVGE